MPSLGNKVGEYTRNQVNDINATNVYHTITITNTRDVVHVNSPAKITPESHKDVVEILDGGTLTGRRQRRLQPYKQRNIEGFSMAPFAGDDLPVNSTSNKHIFFRTDTTKGTENHSHKQVPRPPNLESFKQLWYDSRVVPGDDPKVDEHLRKEIFARKVQRGEFPTRTRNNGSNNRNYTR